MARSSDRAALPRARAMVPFFVVDHNKTQVFASDGSFVRRFSDPKRPETWGDPLAFDSSGEIIVIDNGETSCINVLKFDGTLVSSYGKREPDKRRHDVSVAVDGKGLVFVLDGLGNRIEIFQRHGTFVRAFGKQGKGDGEFSDAGGIAVTDSEVFVADSLNHRIQVFDTDGKLLRKFGSEGKAEGQFRCPTKLCVDDSGHLFVNDAGNHRIQVLKLDGTFISAFGEEGKGIGQFKRAQGICFDNIGRRLLVADEINHRVQVWGVADDSVGVRAIAKASLDMPEPFFH